MRTSQAPTFGRQPILGAPRWWESGLSVRHGVTRNGGDMIAFSPLA